MHSTQLSTGGQCTLSKLPKIALVFKFGGSNGTRSFQASRKSLKQSRWKYLRTSTETSTGRWSSKRNVTSTFTSKTTKEGTRKTSARMWKNKKTTISSSSRTYSMAAKTGLSTRNKCLRISYKILWILTNDFCPISKQNTAPYTINFYRVKMIKTIVTYGKKYLICLKRWIKKRQHPSKYSPTKKPAWLSWKSKNSVIMNSRRRYWCARIWIGKSYTRSKILRPVFSLNNLQSTCNSHRKTRIIQQT